MKFYVVIFSYLYCKICKIGTILTNRKWIQFTISYACYLNSIKFVKTSKKIIITFYPNILLLILIHLIQKAVGKGNLLYYIYIFFILYIYIFLWYKKKIIILSIILLYIYNIYIIILYRLLYRQGMLWDGRIRTSE